MSAQARRVLAPHDIDPAVPAAGSVVREFRGLTMGTTWMVRCALPADNDSSTLSELIQSQLDRVVSQMSTWETGSDLSRYNSAAAGTWHTFPHECFDVLRHALAVAEASNGAYDPTAGPLVNVWGFGPDRIPGERPDEAMLSAARRRVGWQRVEVEPATRRVYQPGGIYLDFSAIAKGYGVDAVMEALNAHGILHALVEVGGELRGQGMKPDGQPWWVGLENPPAAEDERAQLSETVVALHGLSVATSGDYRRFFFTSGEDGTRIRQSHTIDPRSGEPIHHGLAGVTVVHPVCMAADAISTALNVLGPADGQRFAAEHGIAARFVQRSGTTHQEIFSPAFEALCR